MVTDQSSRSEASDSNNMEEEGMGRSISSSKKRNWIPISEFRIGFTVRRLFDDGNWYTARVMTEPQYIFDEEKDKMILCRKVKYYADEQEEYADEDQLNDWAYDVGNDVTFTSDYSDDDSNEKGVEEERHSFDDKPSTVSEVANRSFPDFPVDDAEVDTGTAVTPPPGRRNEAPRNSRMKRKPLEAATSFSSVDSAEHVYCENENDLDETRSSGQSSVAMPTQNAASFKSESKGCRRSKRARQPTNSFITAASAEISLSCSPGRRNEAPRNSRMKRKPLEAATSFSSVDSAEHVYCENENDLDETRSSGQSSVAMPTQDAASFKAESKGCRRSKRARRPTNSFITAASAEISSSCSSSPPASTDSSSTPGGAPARKKKTTNSSVTKGKKTKEEIRNVLIFKMGITEEDIDFALEQLSPPYRENEVINLIHKEREKMQGHSENGSEEALVRFNPEIGMRVRARSGGSNWYGRVTKGPTYMTLAGESKKAKFWEITFDDGTKEDYDWNELLRYRASRPIVKLDDCRGRTLYALELFAGEGIVSQEFSELKWSIKSIDNNPKSYATHILDIMKAKYRDIGFVPDFIWASPPCTTCSNLSGGLHRNCKTGEFEKTQDALEHNQLMAQMMYIMKWAKKRNPHLIVVIENPTGQMQNLPMMIEFMSIFGLHKATVHYCAFGRFDKKPTDLWTNDFNLHARLNKFRCSKGTCAYHNTPHPVGTRSHSHQFNAAAIPQKLAEEVAEYVNAKFVLDQISRLPKVSLSSEEEEEFDFCMSV